MMNIKAIIRAESTLDRVFMEKQEVEIKRLRVLIERKRNGETVDVSDIKKHLQAAGILDKSGNLAEVYSTGKKR